MFAPNTWFAVISHTPYTSIYNADGSFNYDPTPTSVDIYNGKVGNPISDLLNTQSETENTRIIGNGFLEWAIIPQLKLKVSLGADLSNTRQNYYAPSYTTGGIANSGYASIGQTKTNTWQTEYTATYSNVFNRVHSLTVLAGYTAQKTDRSSFATTAYGFSNDATGYDNIGAASTTLPSSSSHYVSTLQSWIGRVNYSYDSRYNASITFRADGSSRFAKNNKWGWFPSIGLSWNIDREKWLRLGSQIDYLQLRLSAGVVGNQEIGDYQAAANVSPTPYNHIVNGQEVVAYYIQNQANPDLKWERTASYNAGISAGFFKSRLSVTLDTYYKKTGDLLLLVPVEQVTGYETSLRNVGSVTNKGVELELGGVLIDQKDLRWTANFNIAFNKNEVTSLGSATSIIPNFSGATLGYISPLIITTGQPLGTFYGYKFKGIVQTDTDISQLTPQSVSPLEPGNPIYEDVNGDGVVNTEDQTVLGNSQPKFTYGFSTSLKWKRFDFFLSLAGSYGNKLYNGLATRLTKGSTYYNCLAVVADRWTVDNPSNWVQKANNDLTVVSDSRYVENASYLRVKNIQLGYTFPIPQVTKDAKIRAYISLQNFFTITNYSGYDPEASRNGMDEHSALYQGVDMATYPTAKTFQFGIQLTL